MTAVDIAVARQPELLSAIDGGVRAFLAPRLPDLLGLAHALCGDAPTSAALVVQAVTRALDEARADDAPDARLTEGGASIAARVWIVRGYLSEGMKLGAPVAADVDAPTPRPAADAPGSHAFIDLADRVAGASKLARTTLVLRYAEGLSKAHIARIVGSTPEGIARYLDDVHTRLGVDEGDEHELATVVKGLRYRGVAQEMSRPLPENGPKAAADYLDVLAMFADPDDTDDHADRRDEPAPARTGRLTTLGRAITGRRAR